MLLVAVNNDYVSRCFTVASELRTQAGMNTWHRLSLHKPNMLLRNTDELPTLFIFSDHPALEENLHPVGTRPGLAG